MSASDTLSLSVLNDAQREAVTYAGGPLMVVAGPGSRKTRVITVRLAYRVLHGGVAPYRLMAITFTHRAADEMRTRVRALLGGDVRLRIGTFHWMCHGLLRRHGRRLGYPSGFVLLDPGEARGVLRAAVAGAHPHAPVSSLARGISAVKNGAELGGQASAQGLAADVLLDCIQRYGDALRRVRALDIDDLLAKSIELLSEYPAVRSQCMSSLNELLVDEYQDTNGAQQELLRLLRPGGGDIIAVGDEDQAIYGWRQASSGSVDRFCTDFPGARVITLVQTYRSTKHILRAASSLIEHNTDRVDKPLQTDNPAGERPICLVVSDEREEADWVAREVARLQGSADGGWRDFAVLYRVNAQSRALEDALVRAGIPYRVHSGLRFYDRPEVRLVTSFLRLALDWSDEGAAANVLRAVPGVGPRRVEALKAETARKERPLADALVMEGLMAALPAPVRAELLKVGRLATDLAGVRNHAASKVVEGAIRAAATVLGPGTAPDEPGGTMEELNELRAALNELGGPRGTLRDFVDRLTLGPDTAVDGDAVTLLSLHSAKGLEFPVVFIVGVEEGLLPHSRSAESEEGLAEERRLCYVGMTRAQSLLYLSFARSRLLGLQASGGTASRFLGEMGSSNLKLTFSTRASLKPRLHAVKPGDRVLHTRWRSGTVRLIEGAGRDTIVTVDFDSGKRHRLQLCHAPLSRLGEEADCVRTG